MRILIVSAVFPPEPVVSSRTSAQIAWELTRRGHDVTVVTTFPSRPAGKLYLGYPCRLIQRQKDDDGFELVRCFSIISAESRMVSRFLENVSFGLAAGWVVMTSRRPDVIYANTWPIFATGILLAVSRIRRVPMVTSVQDVYPESLIAQRRVRADSVLVHLMRWLDRLIARGCRAVIVISERFAAIYRDGRGVATDRVHVVPNWVDSDSVVTTEHGDSFRAARNIPRDAFLAVYGGNIGVAAGVETVIESFRYLKDIENLRLVIAGEGNNLATCQDLAKRVAPERVLFYSPWPIHETSTVLGAADLLVLPTQGSQSIASVPSKLITYMLTARPVVALALPQSDLAEMVERSGCGWIVKPDQPELLAIKLKEVMLMESSKLIRRGQAGREFALRNLTHATCLPRVLDILGKAASN
jgi:glycosyltransferase involved in cell wall biosynthesis